MQSINSTIVHDEAPLDHPDLMSEEEYQVAFAKAGLPAMPRWVNTDEQDNAPVVFIEEALLPSDSC